VRLLEDEDRGTNPRAEVEVEDPAPGMHAVAEQLKSLVHQTTDSVSHRPATPRTDSADQ
jgi:hypothetical protein